MPTQAQERAQTAEIMKVVDVIVTMGLAPPPPPPSYAGPADNNEGRKTREK